MNRKPRNRTADQRLSQLFERRQHTYQTEQDRRNGKLADMLGYVFTVRSVVRGVLTSYNDTEVRFNLMDRDNSLIKLTQDEFWFFYDNGHIIKE